MAKIGRQLSCAPILLKSRQNLHVPLASSSRPPSYRSETSRPPSYRTSASETSSVISVEYANEAPPSETAGRKSKQVVRSARQQPRLQTVAEEEPLELDEAGHPIPRTPPKPPLSERPSFPSSVPLDTYVSCVRLLQWGSYFSVTKFIIWPFAMMPTVAAFWNGDVDLPLHLFNNTGYATAYLVLWLSEIVCGLTSGIGGRAILDQWTSVESGVAMEYRNEIPTATQLVASVRQIVCLKVRLWWNVLVHGSLGSGFLVTMIMVLVGWGSVLTPWHRAAVAFGLMLGFLNLGIAVPAVLALMRMLCRSGCTCPLTLIGGSLQRTTDSCTCSLCTEMYFRI